MTLERLSRRETSLPPAPQNNILCGVEVVAFVLTVLFHSDFAACQSDQSSLFTPRNDAKVNMLNWDLCLLLHYMYSPRPDPRLALAKV